MKRLKERINMRNSIIVILCITIILMGIGYVLMSMKINKEDPYFNISIVKVKKSSSVKGSSLEPTGTNKILKNGKTVNFNFKLNNQYDELSYTITIKNKGNIPGEIIDIIESPEYTTNESLVKQLEPVKISYNDIEGMILEPNESIDIDLVVQYGLGESSKKDINYNLSVVTQSPSN